jgi:hypothetical protein
MIGELWPKVGHSLPAIETGIAAKLNFVSLLRATRVIGRLHEGVDGLTEETKLAGRRLARWTAVLAFATIALTIATFVLAWVEAHK